MTWYLTLRGADDYSRMADTGVVLSWLLACPQLQQSGLQSFRAAEGWPWLEVVLAQADAQGNYHTSAAQPDRINVIEFICSSHAPTVDAEALACQLARHLGWGVHEDSEGRRLCAPGDDVEA